MLYILHRSFSSGSLKDFKQIVLAASTGNQRKYNLHSCFSFSTFPSVPVSLAVKPNKLLHLVSALYCSMKGRKSIKARKKGKGRKGLDSYTHSSMRIDLLPFHHRQLPIMNLIISKNQLLPTKEANWLE